MGGWEYVFLAYGIVWGAILIYFISLKRRLRRAGEELVRLPAVEDSRSHARK
jgi:CcmD family protein